MKPWTGHLPITRIVVFSILNRATTDESDFSRDERVLCTACEFWAAVSTDELHAHLGSQPQDRLRAAAFALNSLGAVVLAQAILAGLRELRKLNSQKHRDEYVAGLQQRLRATEESVDVLIGLFAERCISVPPPVQRATTDAPISGGVGSWGDAAVHGKFGARDSAKLKHRCLH